MLLVLSVNPSSDIVKDGAASAREAVMVFAPRVKGSVGRIREGVERIRSMRISVIGNQTVSTRPIDKGGPTYCTIKSPWTMLLPA